MDLLQTYCTLLQEDLDEYYRSLDPEGWDSMREILKELAAVAAGEPAGESALRALAEFFPDYGPALAMEIAMGKGMETGADASTHGENAGKESAHLMEIIRNWSEGTAAQSGGTAQDGTGGPAGLQSAILTALAQIVTGITPTDGSTPEEALSKALLAASPAEGVSAALEANALEAGIPLDLWTHGLAPEAAGNANINSDRSEIVRQLALRLLEEGNAQTRPGEAGLSGEPGFPGEDGMLGGMPGELDLSGGGSLFAVSAEADEPDAFPQGIAKSVWQFWQAIKEAEEIVAAESEMATAGVPDEDYEFMLTGKFPPEIATATQIGREALDLVESTPLGSVSGRVVAGSPSMGAPRVTSFEIGNVDINGATDKENVRAIATDVTTGILRKEVRRAIDQFDDGVWA